MDLVCALRYAYALVSPRKASVSQKDMSPGHYRVEGGGDGLSVVPLDMPWLEWHIENTAAAAKGELC